MNALSLKAAALVLLGASRGSWGQEITECGPSSNGFDYEVTAQEGFTIHWTMDTAAETIAFQVVSAAIGWTSIGFSADGMMVGSDAVIGLPDDASVLEHEMLAQSPDAVVPFEDQEITEGSVSQDATTTTLMFTRPLVPTGAKQPISAVPGDPTIIIFAYGPENPLGYHGPAPFRGGVVVDLFCGDTVAGGAASAAPSAAPTPAPSATLANTTAPTAMTMAPAAMTAAPTVAEGATASPTMMMTPAPADMDMDTPAPTAAARDLPVGGGPSSTAAPSAAGDADDETGESVVMTAAPSASPADGGVGDGQDTDGASRAAGGRWAAAAVAGVVTVLAALSL
eukprot:g3020.t1